MTSTPTRPVENVITTKGLHDRNIHILDGTTVENKGKLILNQMKLKTYFPSNLKYLSFTTSEAFPIKVDNLL